METIAQYLTELASDSPTPGGGSAATIVAAAGASLLAMVGRICSTNPKYAVQRDLALTLVQRADMLREELLGARVRDEAAFERVVTASAMPKTSLDEEQRRRGALEAALSEAAAVPLQSAHYALEILRLALRELEIPNRNLASDVGCAAEFAHAALGACAYNVRINHRFMRDTAAIEAHRTTLERYEREGLAALSAVRRHVAKSLER